jgi:hypothetical protein
MRLVPRPTLARAATFGGAACLLLAACASVLGVDKHYEVAAPDAGDDARVATTTGILCALDAAPCQAGTQECCMGSDNALSCASTALSDPCPGGTDIRCDDPSDCPNGVCCITLDTGKDLLGAQCETACPTGQTELCSPSSATCPNGQRCQAIAVQPDPPIHDPWFYSCQ